MADGLNMSRRIRRTPYTDRVEAAGVQIMAEVVVRFSMADITARYHIPVILSPNSYSIWWSGE